MGYSAIEPTVAHVLGVVHGVRRRWRMARVLRGVAITLAGVLVTLVASALILEAVKYAPAAVIATRIATAVVALGLLAWLVVRPLLPRPRDEQVALYVEEHEPSFEGSLVSAVEISGADATRAPSPEIAALVRGMAIKRARAVRDGHGVDSRAMRLAFAALGGAAAMLLVVLTMGPASLKYGMGALLTPWASAEEVNPFRLDVTPGDATIARGASVIVTAQPVGFSPGSVELWARSSDTASWMRIPMSSDTTAAFSARLFDVNTATEYLVETSGLRSRVYRLAVADLPYARRLDLEYRFPAYTGLPNQKVDSAGDIAAPAGTRVLVKVTPTVPTNGGRIVVENGDTLALTRADDGTLSATIRVARNTFYRVELEGARGDLLTASLNYAIDVLPDREPSVRFAKPGRDQRVLAVDEVFTEVEAEDDYGVARVDIVYSVNGGPERTVALHRATSRVVREIAAGHTFMLEEYELQPGDVVSYYARAIDNNSVGGAKTVTSDIYFFNVRPYAREYRQAQEGGGGGGGGQQQEPGQLSQRQREIIAGTFNRMREQADPKVMEEDIATLRLAQQRLKDDVEVLARQMVERGVVTMDSALSRIAEILPKAAAAMDTAERILGDGKLREALGPEQRALQHLQRAEAEFRNVQVSMGGGGGGGGGGGQQEPEDLADLFELQQDRMRNQYETVQRGLQDEQQQENAEVDATAERLKQLAARQLQENERARRKADSLGANMGSSGSSGGQSQRQLAQETQEAARQLERLARERQSQELAEAARRLNEASDAMRRSAAAGGQQSEREAQNALERLRDARRLLDEERENRTQRAADDAASSGRRLAEEQRRVQEDVARQTAVDGRERAELQDRIDRRKEAMADSARELARRLERTALESRREAPGVAREMQEAADTLRTRRIEDKIRQTQELVRRQIPQQYQDANERVVAADIDALNRALEEIRVAARNRESADTSRRDAAALDRARDLVRGVESLAERARQQQEQQAQGQQERGQEGRGQEGRGQEGRGQEGRGQQGQQGQQGQGPGQGRGEQGREGGQAGGGANQGGGGLRGGGGQQLSRELRERLNDARALRRELANREGVELDELDRAIGRMQGLSNVGSLSDPRAERELRQQVIEGLRAFEFSLGRVFGDRSGERALVDRSGEIPPQYRKYVEEYYRALGRAKP